MSTENIVPIRDWETNMKCPKCEAERDEHIEIKWRSGGNGDVNSVPYEIPEGFEYLFCKCKSCSFEWLMQTADADERATDEKNAQDKAEEKERDIPSHDHRRNSSSGGHGRRVEGRVQGHPV